jgi:Ni2+-binding GTPase involved in maturation of urease and hydrogenase
MKKQRIMVFSGFLGSGKTTAMVQTAKHLAERGIKAALVTNDLGGNLVDTAYARLENVPVAEISEGCFCHDVPYLTQTFRYLTDTVQPDIILAEPVGSCVDLVRSVYSELDRGFAEQFELAPFVAVMDPVRYNSIYMEDSVVNTFNPPVTYMYKKQLEEAEILLLNKTDTLAQAELLSVLASLEANFPGKRVIPVSSASRDNYQAWIESFTQGQISAVLDLDIDWDYVIQAENTMAWYNKEAEAEAAEPVDWNAFTADLMQSLREAFAAAQLEIAHLKIICANGADYAKAALTGTSRQVTVSRAMSQACKKVKLNVNIRALTLVDKLEELMESMLTTCAARHNVYWHRQKLQAFDSFAHAPEAKYIP